VGRLTGFVLLTTASMALLGALAILPPYAHLARARWEASCARLGVEDVRQMVQANQKRIEALANDPVLIKRLAMSQTDYVPRGEVVVDTDQPPLPPPDMVVPPRTPLPPKPDNWLIHAAGRIEDPSTRRGLLFVSMTTLLGALLLFVPPGSTRRRS
jgi:hypothetical protein